MRLGRGDSAGHGSFCGRGCKGQLARVGKGKVRPQFEGGQTSFIQKFPKKKGFHNHTRVAFMALNVELLNAFEDGTMINQETLFAKGLIDSKTTPVKILGEGKLTKKVTVHLPASAAAKEKIEKAGGTVVMPALPKEAKEVPEKK